MNEYELLSREIQRLRAETFHLKEATENIITSSTAVSSPQPLLRSSSKKKHKPHHFVPQFTELPDVVQRLLRVPEAALPELLRRYFDNEQLIKLTDIVTDPIWQDARAWTWPIEDACLDECDLRNIRKKTKRAQGAFIDHKALRKEEEAAKAREKAERDQRRAQAYARKKQQEADEAERAAARQLEEQQTAELMEKFKPRLSVQLTEEQRKDIADAFVSFDTDGSGSIDAEELREALAQLGFGMSLDAVVRMIRTVDADGTDTIDLEEFTELMTPMFI
eukprot:PhM_4_TR10877/c0_g1_i1/m.15938